MNIRQATLLDLLALSELGQLYADEAEKHELFPFDLELTLTNAALTIQNENGCFLVAFIGSEPVGFLWGYCHPLPWSKSKLAADNILYVVPEYRKTRVAFSLMREWEGWAKSRGAAQVQISIASGIDEESTVSFYKKMGYSYTGQQFRKEV